MKFGSKSSHKPMVDQFVQPACVGPLFFVERKFVNLSPY